VRSRHLIILWFFCPCSLKLLWWDSNSNPEDRRVTPENVNGRKKFKIVYVVLESQYQASMTVACKRINAAQVLIVVVPKLVIESPLLDIAESCCCMCFIPVH
jgi:hypothetical protein